VGDLKIHPWRHIWATPYTCNFKLLDPAPFQVTLSWSTPVWRSNLFDCCILILKKCSWKEEKYVIILNFYFLQGPTNLTFSPNLGTGPSKLLLSVTPEVYSWFFGKLLIETRWFFESLLTTFEESVIFRSRLGSCKNRLDRKTKPLWGNLTKLI